MAATAGACITLKAVTCGRLAAASATLRFCENDGAAGVVDRAELATLALALLDDWMVNATTIPPWRR